MITSGNIKETVRQRLLRTGASAIGFTSAGPTGTDEIDRQKSWTERGFHSGMDYLARHIPLKEHTDNVLPGCQTIISIAFSYAGNVDWREGLPVIASYARGDDYHDVLRKRLKKAVDELMKEYGGGWRICIDSAPLTERHLALKAGLGCRGMNGFVIVDGCGTRSFLAEILTTLVIDPDSPSRRTCLQCGACVKSCPTGALLGDGSVDARRCLNYLTIEHKGDWDGVAAECMRTTEGRNTIFGCDVCQNVCPHNDGIPSTLIGEFNAKEFLTHLKAEEIVAMKEDNFSAVFRGSPLKRAGLSGLRRNARNCLE